ncbi:MAG: hypothetical protein IID38_04665 [Planctomycetes bacterium]|nr:hypothetical protein [Planctomycetota bacterium]
MSKEVRELPSVNIWVAVGQQDTGKALFRTVQALEDIARAEARGSVLFECLT